MADIISTYVYRKGLIDANFGYSTAVGLFNSVANLLFLSATNWISNRATGLAYSRKEAATMPKRTAPQNVFNVYNIAIMVLLMIVTLYPFYYVIVASFTSSAVLEVHTGML